jgi:hypothetical protein
LLDRFEKRYLRHGQRRTFLAAAATVFFIAFTGFLGAGLAAATGAVSSSF